MICFDCKQKNREQQRELKHLSCGYSIKISSYEKVSENKSHNGTCRKSLKGPLIYTFPKKRNIDNCKNLAQRLDFSILFVPFCNADV